jgi:DNA-binding CsgD family transcriptional regulator
MKGSRWVRGPDVVAVEVRSVEEMLTTVASVVAGLLDDAGLDQRDERMLRITCQPDHPRVQVTVCDAERSLGTRRVPLSLATAPLTDAEHNVLRYLPSHLNYPQIAEVLCLSRHTVKSHAVAIYRKLGVSSRAAAVQTARELGLLAQVVALSPPGVPKATCQPFGCRDQGGHDDSELRPDRTNPFSRRHA